MSGGAHAEVAMRLVFQYGSNCLDSEINGKQRLNGAAKFISIAETVSDYELAFDVFSNGRHCAAADMLPKPGAKAWGVLYEIPEFLIDRDTAKAGGSPKSLDGIEGAGGNYERKEIAVRKPSGEIVSALTYTVRHPTNGLKTSAEYARLIIAGLRERGIPSDYIEKVKTIASQNNPDITTEIERL